MLDRPRLDASRYQGELGSLAQLLILQIEREWPSDRIEEAPGAATLLTTLQLALRYWNAEHFLVFTSENPTAGWYPEHSLVLPVIDRSLLEMACNVIFICEDVTNRGIWFIKAGWREAKIEWDRLNEEYAIDHSPEWTNYLSERSKLLEDGRSRLKITVEQAGHPKKMPSWPSIGSLKDYELTNGMLPDQLPSTRRVIRHLYDWFYPELSAIAHSNGYAHLVQGALAGGMSQSSEQRAMLRERVFPFQQSRSLFRSSMFLLCIVCEIQQCMGYRELVIEARLLHVWELLSTQGEVREVFDLRYREMYNFPPLT